MNTTFELEKRRDKAGDVITKDMPIRLVVTFNGGRVMFYSGYRIDFDKWDSTATKVKQGCSNGKGIPYNIINKRLNEMQGVVNAYDLYCIGNSELPVKDELKRRMSEMLGKGTTQPNATECKTLLNIFDEFVADCGQGNDWTPATYEKFAAMRKHLLGFNAEPNFEMFDEKGLTAYVVYLRDIKKMRNTTIGKQLGFLKWFLRWATAKEYNSNNAFTTFRPKLKSTEKRVVFLTWDELMTVYTFDIPESKQYLARVRDVFCFCCFTSLRYSDVFNLKRSDIKGDSIQITTVKTSDSLTIELNKYSRAILDKYADGPFKGNKALPVISNQRMNDYIKELGELCEIDEPQSVTYYVGNKRVDEVYPKYELLGTHAGRRTFICNALSLGIPAQVVMKWTGHSDYKAMKPYIDIADKIKADAMNKFNEI